MWSNQTNVWKSTGMNNVEKRYAFNMTIATDIRVGRLLYTRYWQLIRWLWIA